MGRINYSFTKLGDFNEVVMYYIKQLELIKRMQPMKRFEFKDEFKELTFAFDRALINNIGISVAKNFDYVEKHAPKNIDELILNELTFNNESSEMSRLVTSCERAFRKLMKDNNLTPFETLHQIRNALLHGNYVMAFRADSDKDSITIVNYSKNEDDECLVEITGDREVYLKSSKMEGVVPYEIIHILDYIVYNISSKCTISNREFTTADKRYISCKNEYFLSEYLKSLQSYCVIPKGKREKGNMEQIISRFPNLKEALEAMNKIDGTNYFEFEKISEEEMQRRRKDIENYIRYVGKENWKHFYFDGINTDLFDNIFQSRFNDTIRTISLSNSFCRLINSMCEHFRKGTQINRSEHIQMIKLSFQQPLIYSEMILGLMNYECGYLKANSAEDNSLFEYHNLEGFEGVIPTVDNDKIKSIQYGVSGKEKQAKIDSAIENCKAQLKKVNRKINNANKQIGKLNDKNPNKKKIEAELQDNKLKRERIMAEIFKLSTRREEYSEDYIDYSELFRHLRNSIAHGRYKIEYDRALKTHNLDKIRFTFYDYNEDNKEENKPDFEISLTAAKILKIINGIYARVNRQLDMENKLERIVKTKLEDFMPEMEFDDGDEVELD